MPLASVYGGPVDLFGRTDYILVAKGARNNRLLFQSRERTYSPAGAAGRSVTPIERLVSAPGAIDQQGGPVRPEHDGDASSFPWRERMASARGHHRRFRRGRPGRPAILGWARAQSPNQAGGYRQRIGFRGVEGPGRKIIPRLDDQQFTIGTDRSPDARPLKVLNKTSRANEGFHFGSIPLARRKYQAGGQRSAPEMAPAVDLGTRFYFPGNLPGSFERVAHT